MGEEGMLRGGLFTQYFLEDGIRGMDQYRRLGAAEMDAFVEAVSRHWPNLSQMPHPSEAETESEFIFPILSLLGWEHLPQQEPGGGHEAPSTQILRYLGRAEAQSGGTLRWGLLSNGRFWLVLVTGPGEGGGLRRNRTAGANRRLTAASAGRNRPSALATGLHAALQSERAHSRRSARRDFS